MPEKPPVASDNLYDETGRVKDIDAAREMAEFEGFHREIDKDRLFAPGKKERSEREAALNAAGLRALEAREQQRVADQAETARRRQGRREYDAFIRRKLYENGLSESEWLTASTADRVRLERSWQRKEQRSPEWALEQRLQSLVGRTIIAFDVGDFGDIQLRLEDGSILRFTSWDAGSDAPDYDGVRVEKTVKNPKGQPAGSDPSNLPDSRG